MRLLASLLVTCLSSLVWAETWNLSESSVHFTSIKNGVAPVAGSLKTSGTLTGTSFQVEVDLNSVDTGNPLRDRNIATALFEAMTFPKMVLTGRLPKDAIPAKLGETRRIEVASTIDYRGTKTPVNFPMVLTRIGEHQIIMATAHAVSVSLSSLGLMNGALEALIKLCQHKAVAPFALVTFSGSWNSTKP